MVKRAKSALFLDSRQKAYTRKAVNGSPDCFISERNSCAVIWGSGPSCNSCSVMRTKPQDWAIDDLRRVASIIYVIAWPDSLEAVEQQRESFSLCCPAHTLLIAVGIRTLPKDAFTKGANSAYLEDCHMQTLAEEVQMFNYFSSTTFCVCMHTLHITTGGSI